VPLISESLWGATQENHRRYLRGFVSSGTSAEEEWQYRQTAVHFYTKKAKMEILNFSQFIAKLRSRGRIEAAQAYLSLKQRLSGRPLWIDHGCIRLPFHGDGDRQELYYYLDGKTWWNDEFRSISQYLGQGGVAVDVGANLGFMSGIFSGLVGPSGRVHSFEPSPVVYGKLLEVIQANDYVNVLPYNIGCGKEESSLVLHSPSSSGHATLRPNAGMEGKTPEKQIVRIVKMDEFLGLELERLDLLKIDTEGYEDEVLAGAAGLIQKFKPIIYIELCSEYLISSQNARRILLDHGYTFDRKVALDESSNGANFLAFPPGMQPAYASRGVPLAERTA
jgi:FkbM family methyltransferase